jgi:hypothetical protein
MRYALYVLLSLVAICAIGSVQTFRGGISDIVADQTDAVVPSAILKATNQATGLAYTTTSSSAGEFSFTDLPLGSYSIVVTSSGFSTLTVNDIRVSAGSVYNLPLKMEVAQVASSEEVSAAALAMQTTDTTLNTTITTQTVQNLPVNGRDFTR